MTSMLAQKDTQLQQANTGNPCIDRFLGHCHLRRYPAKNLIIYAGDTPDTLYYILEGSVTVLMDENDGREIVLAYLNKGDFFGEMGLFEGQRDRSAWVRARSDCLLAEISYSRFKQLCQQTPELLFELSGQMAARLRRTSQKVGDLAFMDVTGHPPGAGPHRRLLAGNGRAGAQGHGGTRPAHRRGQNHRGLRYPLGAYACARRVSITGCVCGRTPRHR